MILATDHEDPLDTLRALRVAITALQEEMRHTPATDRARVDDQVRRLAEIGRAHIAVRARLGRERLLRAHDLRLVRLEARVRRLEEHLNLAPSA